MRLQDELSGTENRISVARKRYNDALTDYNTFILPVPQQHLGRNRRLPAEQRLLHGQPGGADRAQREVLERFTDSARKVRAPSISRSL